jgi:hypothetical protein
MVLAGLRLMKSFIKAQRLRWLGHAERMTKKTDVENIYKWKLITPRPVRRRRLGAWIM